MWYVHGKKHMTIWELGAVYARWEVHIIGLL